MTPNFTHRDQNKFESIVSSYEIFALSLVDGYDMCRHEYANDISCRQTVEDNIMNPVMAEMRERITNADNILLGLLIPLKQGFHGNFPQTCFWYWGYPRNSPELDVDFADYKLA
jgi:hypothetical protein